MPGQFESVAAGMVQGITGPTRFEVQRRYLDTQAKEGQSRQKTNASTRQRRGDGFNEGRAEGSSKIQPPTNARIMKPSNFAMAAPNKNVSPRPSRARSFSINQRAHCTKPITVKKTIGRVPPSIWT